MYHSAVNPVCTEQAPKAKIMGNRAMLRARTSEISGRSIRSTLNGPQPSSSEGNQVGKREMMNRYVSSNASNNELSFNFRAYPRDSL